MHTHTDTHCSSSIKGKQGFCCCRVMLNAICKSSGFDQVCFLAKEFRRSLLKQGVDFKNILFGYS